MRHLFLEPTQTTPLVIINSFEGTIELKGKSSPENALKFYMPILKTTYKLFRHSISPINVDMSFTYFNTSSAKCLFSFFKVLRVLKQRGVNITINWCYEEEDEDMLEIGTEYEEILNLSFNYIEVKSISHMRQAI